MNVNEMYRTRLRGGHERSAFGLHVLHEDERCALHEAGRTTSEMQVNMAMITYPQAVEDYHSNASEQDEVHVLTNGGGLQDQTKWTW